MLKRYTHLRAELDFGQAAPRAKGKYHNDRPPWVMIEWQNRPLDELYPIVYMDCIRIKVRQDKRVINKAIYIALGINLHDEKEVLGLWIQENEGARIASK